MLEPTVLKDLLSSGWETLPFFPFRDGISISSILEGSPAIAVLLYEPGARVPLHEHVGAELATTCEDHSNFGVRATAYCGHRQSSELTRGQFAKCVQNPFLSRKSAIRDV